MKLAHIGTHKAYENEMDDLGRSSDKILQVSICGHYQVMYANYQSNRPKGRRDYHIIYVTKSKIQVFFEGDETGQWIEEGNMILYRPGEKQHYLYFKEDMPEVYWLHFAGTGVPTLLDGFGLHTGNVFYVGQSKEVCNIMHSMISELQIRRYNYDAICNSYFLKLIGALTLEIEKREVKIPDVHYEGIRKVIEHMNSHYYDKTDNEEYARMCNMSKYHFMRIFKEEIGVSPHAYKIKVRMKRAQSLLRDTDITISEISSIVGYDDVVCFSRQFKQYIGISPTLFRLEHRI